MSSIYVLYRNNDHILELQGLKNELTGAALDAATVTVTLVDGDGDAVAGDTWPKTMAAVAALPGTYRCTLVYGLDLDNDGRYTARITANAGNGLRAYWEMECVARNRG